MADAGSVAGGAGAGAAAGAAFGGIGAGVGALIGGIGSLFGGGSKQSSGFTLPPELEIPFLEQFQTQLSQMQQDYQRISEAYSAYSDKLSALDSIIGGGDKQEGLRALQESNFRIAGSLGMSTEDLVKNNFISAEDRADLDKISSGVGVDPQQEKQISDERARLEQDLRRSGQSPAIIAQELKRFDQAAREARFQRGWELVQAKGQLRQQGFGQAMSSFGATTGYAGQALSALSQSAGSRFQALQSTLQQQQGLRGEGQEAYKTMGQFKLSKPTKQLLAGGAIGPGSLQQQTGIARGSTGSYWNWVNRQEVLQPRTGMGVQRGPSEFMRYFADPKAFINEQQRAIRANAASRPRPVYTNQYEGQPY